MTTLLLSRQCQGCKRLQEPEDERWTCEAFPKGIPKAIMMEVHDHALPFEGDNGLLFEPKEEDGGK